MVPVVKFYLFTMTIVKRAGFCPYQVPTNGLITYIRMPFHDIIVDKNNGNLLLILLLTI
jgi:hypothetical protein